MSLLADIEADLRHGGANCTVASILAVLDATDADELRAALVSKRPDGEWRYPGAAISRALAKRDIVLQANTIGRHRRGECACPSPTS